MEHSIALSRWLAKKSARTGVAAASLPLTWLPSHRNRLRVLTYHRFAREARSPFSVSAAALERQVKWLAEHGLAVGSDAVGSVLGGAAPARDAVLVTIDDGDPTVLSEAAPIFASYGVPFILYAIPGRLGRRDHMSAADLRELAGLGGEIGSHSVSHRSLTSLSRAELAAELADSRKMLEDITGRAVTSFAYPFGTIRDFDRRAADMVRSAGYLFAFTSQHGAIGAGDDPMLLSRIKIEGGDPDWVFRAACRGALDQWRLVDHSLAALQKPQPHDRADAGSTVPLSS